MLEAPGESGGGGSFSPVPPRPRADPSPAVPTDLVRGIPFRREPGSFSGPGRPWRSNNDCGSRGGHMEAPGHQAPRCPPPHPRSS